MQTQIIIAAIILGGLAKGLNGFGYALISTSILATVLPAQEAVALMIIPLILANLELTAKLTLNELKECFQRFRSYILFAFIGVITAMALIDSIPAPLLKKGVGLLVLIFVSSRIPRISGLFSETKDFCVENPKVEPVLGLFSGLIFGSTNVGVPVVAYFKELQLSREKFLSVMALTILGASMIRLGLAYHLGLYSGTDRIFLSIALGVLGLLAVKLGDVVGQKTSDRMTQNLSLFLLAVIGLRLLGTF